MKALALLAVALIMTAFAYAQGVTATDDHLDYRKELLSRMRTSPAGRASVLRAVAQASAGDEYHIARWRSFDAPGAGRGGTQPVSINDLGEIVGYFFDATPSESQHGMFVARDGRVTTFDLPGSTYFETRAINNLGAVVGGYADDLGQVHGFIRTREGHITQIDVPGAVGTKLSGINDLGAIVGWYWNAEYITHGFLREPNGTYITIDGPNAQQITFCFVVNENSEVGCQFIASTNNFWRALLRHRDGSTEVFDAPGVADNGACQNTSGVFPTGTEIGEIRSLTNAGVISGHWEDAKCQLHGFVRGPRGRFEVFALPPTAISALADSSNSVNGFGTIVGCYAARNSQYGYARLPNGKLVEVVPPHRKYQEICPLAINSTNVFTGDWIDEDGVYHGFVAEVIP